MPQPSLPTLREPQMSPEITECFLGGEIALTWKSLLKQEKYTEKHENDTVVGSHSLLQRISVTQRSHLGLLHCRWILYWLSRRGSPCTGCCILSFLERPQPALSPRGASAPSPSLAPLALTLQMRPTFTFCPVCLLSPFCLSFECLCFDLASLFLSNFWFTNYLF